MAGEYCELTDLCAKVYLSTNDLHSNYWLYYGFRKDYSMANQLQLAIAKRGDYEWNQWRVENPDAEIDLSGADLRHAKLSDVNLSEADLSDASLNRVNLKRAKLINVDLPGANLISADLSRAGLSGADLTDVQIWEANLTNANLTDASLV